MIPETLKIGAKTFRVQQYPFLSDVEESGHCVKDRGLIRIEENQPEDEKQETLLHEILHCCCGFAGIEDGEKLTEEQFISRVSPILHTVLVENGYWNTDVTPKIAGGLE